ncbi:MAG: serine hydrolase, partial [Aeoliella sp.]
MNCLLRSFFVILALVGGLLSIPAATAQPAESEAAAQTLDELLTPLIKQHRGDVSVMIKHLPTGEMFSYRAEETMPTASLIKLSVMMAAYQA